MTDIVPKQPQAHILVVEDHEVNQELMKEILERLNCLVEIAENGVVALNSLKTTQYDLIFMDLHMPELDGFETTKAIRQMEQGKKSTPIVALTASDTQNYRERCVEVGMNGCLTKPFVIKEIEEALKKYLPTKQN